MVITIRFGACSRFCKNFKPLFDQSKFSGFSVSSRCWKVSNPYSIHYDASNAERLFDSTSLKPSKWTAGNRLILNSSRIC